MREIQEYDTFSCLYIWVIFWIWKNGSEGNYIYAQLNWKQIFDILFQLNWLNNNSNWRNIANISNDSAHKLSITEVDN